MATEHIYVSAPGKVILHGEHAVVYGKAAIAASLNLRSFLRLQSVPNGAVALDLPDVELQRKWSVEELTSTFRQFCSNGESGPPTVLDDKFIQALREFSGIDATTSKTSDLALVAFLYLYLSICHSDRGLPGVEVLVSSLLPVGAGLGSSAAFCVCVTASLLLKAGKVPLPKPGDASHGGWTKTDLELINPWAFLGEKIIHGTPSGIDNSISCYGGAIHFQAGKITPITQMPELKILLVNTKVPRSTKILVAGVRKRHDKYPEVVVPILDSIEAITTSSQQALATLALDNTATEQYSTLEDLIDMNQCQLQALGVSHPTLEQIVAMATRHGHHGKLTGAGGGGCAFVLLRPDTTESTISALSEELRTQGFQCWETRVGAVGVSTHTDVSDLPPMFK